MIPDEVRRLAEERERARAVRDFATADALRDEIREAGFEVVDTPAGPDLLPSRPERPTTPAAEFSVQWVVQGWPEDVERGLASFRRHAGGRSVEFVVVHAAVDEREWPAWAEVLPSAPAQGWAAARNAGLRAGSGRITVLVDGSVEATGDVFGPIEDALSDPAVGLTGPFGIVSDDLREFREDPGPGVDAVEGYLMAFRSELLAGGLAFDEKFRFYRTADIEFSFQIKAKGLRATVTPLPLARHEHRMWTNTPEDERDRLSKRNFYRFLDKWRSRTDLLVRQERR